jgi:26S proteasome regulatory subunit N6
LNVRLAQIYATAGRFADIIKMLRENNSYFGVIPKSRTAKVVRGILDIVARLPDSQTVQVDLCRGVVEWCREEKRTFLRQRVEARVSRT